MRIRGISMLTCGKILILCFCWLLIIRADCQKTDPKEVKALQSIKRSLIDPDNNLAHWNKRDPCTSNWTEVICYNTTLFLINKNLSGRLSPELGRLSYLTILDFMWNKITGTIPKEIGNITTLELLLLNGNQLTGSLPDELGKLSNLDRIQIDQNQISGSIPPSFANLAKAKHFHMNNNSLSGQIPPELSQLTTLVHLLLDNNNLSGYLPRELSEMQSLLILQLDNNNFSGSVIPSSYANMSHLTKLSLRNCNVEGPIPDWSNMPNISYIDLSMNQLNGPIPAGALSVDITTIDLSNNNLNGTIPSSLLGLPRLQKLSIANNSMSGSIPSIIWQNRTLDSNERLFLDFGNNTFTNITGNFLVPPSVTIGLQGNPLCLNNNLLVQYCGPEEDEEEIFDHNNVNVTNLNDCPPHACPPNYEYTPATLRVSCFCAAPLLVGYRLKSPGFVDFQPYVDLFLEYLTAGLQMEVSQIEIDSVAWQKGPRLRMYLKIFPPSVNDSVRLFNRSQVLSIRSMFSGWTIPDNKFFGPFELLNFTLTEAYRDGLPSPSASGINKGALAGIIVGAVAGSLILSAILAYLTVKRYIHKHRSSSKRRQSTRISMRIADVKDFSFRDMKMATDDFSSSFIVGEGGYGKVYRGVLDNGTTVAVKRAEQGSLQGENEFLTEIELLSRLHHRNLVSLIGYCDEDGEQMLVYEFMPNGTLRDHMSGNVENLFPIVLVLANMATESLKMGIKGKQEIENCLHYGLFLQHYPSVVLITGKSKVPLNFSMRIRHALGSAKGILYLHTEADPPIFHRDIKASNILLDANFTAKVADFGLSRLAPDPMLEGDTPAHVSTVVKGTPGYLDPEYFLTRQLTDKSDVYSLGVVFLELLTGRYPISHGKNIVREVNNAYNMGLTFSIVDERMGSYPSECVVKFLNLALKCCQNETDLRPSMAEVVRELENIWNMMSDTDIRVTTENYYSDPGKIVTPPSSSSFMNNMYSSEDVSGSDLASGIIPRVTPR